MSRKNAKPKRRPSRRPPRSRVSPETLLHLQAKDGSVRLSAQRARTVEEPAFEQRNNGAGKRLAHAAGESLRYSALSVLALAERRITNLDLVRLERLVEQEPEQKTVAESLDFLGQFWGVIMRATLNPQLERQVSWKLRQASELQRPYGMGLESNTRILSKAPYRGLVQALRRGYGAPAFWAQRLEAIAAKEG